MTIPTQDLFLNINQSTAAAQARQEEQRVAAQQSAPQENSQLQKYRSLVTKYENRLAELEHTGGSILEQRAAGKERERIIVALNNARDIVNSIESNPTGFGSTGQQQRMMLRAEQPGISSSAVYEKTTTGKSSREERKTLQPTITSYSVRSGSIGDYPIIPTKTTRGESITSGYAIMASARGEPISLQVAPTVPTKKSEIPSVGITQALSAKGIFGEAFVDPMTKDNIDYLEGLSKTRPGIYRVSDDTAIVTTLGAGTFSTTFKQPIGQKATGEFIYGAESPATVSVRTQTPIGTSITGKTLYAYNPAPEEKIVYGINLFDKKNVAAIQQNAGSYKNAGELFGAATAPVSTAVITPMNNKKTFDERLLGIGLSLGKKSAEYDILRGEATGFSPATRGGYSRQRLLEAKYSILGTGYGYGALSVGSLLGARESVRSGKALLAGGLGAVFRGGEIGLTRLTTSTRAGTRLVGKIGLGSLKYVGAPLLVGSYTADVGSRLKNVQGSTPEERLLNFGGVLGGTAVETASFGIGYYGTSAVVPEKAFATTGAKEYFDVKSITKYRYTVEGTDINIPKIQPRTTTTVSYTEDFTGWRGGETVKTNVKIKPSGDIIKTQSFSEGKIITTQKAGENNGLMIVKRTGKNDLLYSGENMIGGGIITPQLVGTQRVKDQVQTNFLVQGMSRRTIFDYSDMSGKNIISGKLYGEDVLAVASGAEPTIFSRSDLLLKDYGNGNVGIVKENLRTFGIADTKLVVGTKRDVARNEFLLTKNIPAESLLSVRDLNDAFYGGSSGAMMSSTLFGKKGKVKSLGEFESVVSGRVYVGKQRTAITPRVSRQKEKSSLLRNKIFDRISTTKDNKNVGVSQDLISNNILKSESLSVSRLKNDMALESINLPRVSTKQRLGISSIFSVGLRNPTTKVSDLKTNSLSVFSTGITNLRQSNIDMISQSRLPKTSLSQSNIQITRERVTQVQTPKITTTFLQIPSVGTPFGGIVTTGITIPKIPETPPPPIFGGGGGGGLFGEGKRNRREKNVFIRRRYTPTLAAASFGIFGKPLSGAELTGLSLRPLLRG